MRIWILNPAKTCKNVIIETLESLFTGYSEPLLGLGAKPPILYIILNNVPGTDNKFEQRSKYLIFYFYKGKK